MAIRMTGLRSTFTKFGLTASALILVACSGSRPIHLGEALTSIQNCPESPNCVSTSAAKEDAEHAIAPINYSSKETTHSQLVSLLENNPAANLIVKTPDYLYAEYTSKLMRYVDDVEFLFTKDKNQIEVRSASRLGYKDFGVNRERIENIRKQLEPTMLNPAP